ncbi:unnamed protein product, partial [Didymodactylos carnosus]
MLTNSIPSILKQPVVYYLDSQTSIRSTEDLITVCTGTKHYIIDTESDLNTHLPSIIQILPIPADSSATLTYYNQLHHHSSDCPVRKLQLATLLRDEYLLTTTPYDDLEGDENADHPELDHPNCDFRSYKHPGNPWSLQRALVLQFGLFFFKNHTCSNWSAGIDLQLRTWKFHNDKLRREQRQIRQELELYAINDVIAVW